MSAPLEPNLEENAEGRHRRHRSYAASGPLSRGYAAALVFGRFLVVPLVLAAAVVSYLYLPGLGRGEALELGGLVPQDAEALAVLEREVEAFGFPLTSDVLIVQHDPDGLSEEAQEAAVRAAISVSQGEEGLDQVPLVVPLINVGPLAEERPATTIVSYLFYRDPGLSLPHKTALAFRYLERHFDTQDAVVGITGPTPARTQQFNEIKDAIHLVEAATVAIIVLLLALAFRAVLVPAIVLASAGVSYVVSTHVIGWLGQNVGMTIPQEVNPFIVAMTLGLVTDYSIFYLSRTRYWLSEGAPRLEAARRGAAEAGPIVLTAGLIVSGGTLAMLLADLEFFRAFGPGMAVTAFVCAAVSMLLTPALLALLGAKAFWPSAKRHQGQEQARETEMPEKPARWRRRLARLATTRPAAALMALVAVALLGLATTGLDDTRLGVRIVRGLPAETPEVRAARAAAEGFPAGVVAPTSILVEAEGATEAQYAALEELLAEQPEVANVLGPSLQLEGVPVDAFLTEGLARYAVVLNEWPFSSLALDDLDALESRLPALAEEAGLEDAEVSVGGQTALVEEAVASATGGAWEVIAVALAVNFLFLMIFLRSLLAPLYLLFASVLSIAATLGLATYFFQGLLGHSELVYYVPLAVGVLLVSLGSDYNVFIAGRIWQEARLRPLREAVAEAVPKASRAITVAGLALALSFAALAIVPLDDFRLLAFLLAVGIILEAFLVRSLLIPALVVLFGRVGMWPSKPGAPSDHTGEAGGEVVGSPRRSDVKTAHAETMTGYRRAK